MSERGIKEVHYLNNDKSKGIEKVKTVSIIGQTIFTIETEETKQTVINNINSKIYEYYTVVNDKKGSKVEVIDNEYIRSDANNTKSDNLGSLETF